VEEVWQVRKYRQLHQQGNQPLGRRIRRWKMSGKGGVREMEKMSKENVRRKCQKKERSVPHFYGDVSLFDWRTTESNERAAFDLSLMVGEDEHPQLTNPRLVLRDIRFRAEIADVARVSAGIVDSLVKM
jgi:hypothetical protein